VAGGTEPASWKATSVLSAPEAVQAAAADEHFAYAVSNTQVAKYDRISGQRLAVSTSEAKHLNSAFLLDGVLYCAHSNYPQLPAKSELKALNLENMQLTTFHDFCKQQGSLTWAVFYANQWWCNFAHYGKENARTYLVKYNTEWQEQSRWVYPPAVIQKLGNYSLSGGIWLADELIVTGHDDPLVFRLRLPKSGRELEYLGEVSVPFTGQGIAFDPLTKGLVGINRAKKQMVFADSR
jgi:hypothetical protein